MKAFLVRIGLFTPFVLFGVYISLLLLGVAANFLGLQSDFHADAYFAMSVVILVMVVSAMIICQANACFRRSDE